MNDSKSKKLIESLENGITCIQCDGSDTEPNLHEAGQLMKEAADQIKELQFKLQEAIILLSEGECPWIEGSKSYCEFWNKRKDFIERIFNE